MTTEIYEGALNKEIQIVISNFQYQKKEWANM